MKYSLLGIAGLFIGTVAYPLSTVEAQQMPSSGPIAADAPEMMILVEARPDSIIRLDLATARGYWQEAEVAVREITRAYDIVRGRIEVRKREGETLKARIDLAKKENRETEQQSLEQERETIERHVRLLERLRDLYDAEKRYEEARREYEQAGTTLFEHELALAGTRNVEQTTGEAVMNRGFMDAQRQVLEAQRTRAEREQTMAQRQRDVFDRRIRLLQMQVEWLAQQT